MTIKEKAQLVYLLRMYQNELMEINERNRKADKDYPKYSQEWYRHIVCGVKAQYNHARVVADRLDVEIENDISTTL